MPAQQTDNRVADYSWADALVPWMQEQDISACRKVWEAYADELAQWTYKHLVIRDDAYCHYTTESVTTVRNWRGEAALTLDILRQHYQGKRRTHIMGPHVAIPQLGPDHPPSGLTRTIAWDIDCHDNDVLVDPIKNHRFALLLFDRAWEWGQQWQDESKPWAPLLTDSNGAGGFHLRMFWDDPIPVEDAHRFGVWLCRDHLINGLKQVEVYPKQLRATALTHFLRLPGHHHTRHHWSRVWNGTSWLDGEAAVRYILGLASLVSFNLPSVASNHTVPGPAQSRPPVVGATDSNTDFTVALIRDALTIYTCEHLHNDDIFKVGAALSHLGPVGWNIWITWLHTPDSPYWRDHSENRYRYTQAYFTEMWSRFQDGKAYAWTLGTIFYLAKQAGWDQQARCKAIGRKVRGRRVLERGMSAAKLNAIKLSSSRPGSI
jgi:hypothetical protein